MKDIAFSVKQNFRFCKDCNKHIENAKKNTLYCEKCRKIRRKQSKKSYFKRNDIPASAQNGQYYKFWKFIKDLKVEELQELFRLRKLKTKSDPDNIKKYRTEMVLINEAFKLKVKDFNETKYNIEDI